MTPHTTEDEEPKFGLSVTGLVHPDRAWTNAGARAGDGLVLTKPIGSGVLFNANLGGKVSRFGAHRINVTKAMIRSNLTEDIRVVDKRAKIIDRLHHDLSGRNLDDRGVIWLV